MERRKGERESVCFEVLIIVDPQNTLVLQAVDASEIGIYVLSEGQKIPIIGTVVQVELNGPIENGGQAPLLDMIIKRVDSSGFGLQYLSFHTDD